MSIGFGLKLVNNEILEKILYKNNDKETKQYNLDSEIYGDLNVRLSCDVVNCKIFIDRWGGGSRF